jgi:hypothetical protein
MLCPRDLSAAGYALFKDAAVLGRAAPIARERDPPMGVVKRGLAFSAIIS